MKGYSDSLRGYGHSTHKKYNFTCQYCGYDGRAFPFWFQLTVDHILPKSHKGKDHADNKITVCHACNSITSRMKFRSGTTVERIIEMKRARVKERQAEYFKFWRSNVAPLYLSVWKDSDSANKR